MKITNKQAIYIAIGAYFIFTPLIYLLIAKWTGL